MAVANRVCLNEPDHDTLACDLARDLRLPKRAMEAMYGRAAMRRIPVFGIRHYLGHKVHGC